MYKSEIWIRSQVKHIKLYFSGESQQPASQFILAFSPGMKTVTEGHILDDQKCH